MEAKDWLMESIQPKDNFGFMDLGGDGFMSSLPRLDVGGDFSTSTDATLIPYQERGFSGIAWKSLPERIRDKLDPTSNEIQVEANDVAYSLAANYEYLVGAGGIKPEDMNILSAIPFTQEEAIALLAQEKYSMDLLDNLIFKGLYDEDELEQYMILKAKEDDIDLNIPDPVKIDIKPKYLKNNSLCNLYIDSIIKN